MPIRYYVTINTAEKENRFKVSWYNPETGTKDSF